MKHGMKGGEYEGRGNRESGSGTYGANPVQKAPKTPTSRPPDCDWHGIADSRPSNSDRKQTAK